MTRALHGFEDLRTRPLEPPTQPEKRCCTKCDAVLRQGNTGTLCAPCGGPEGLTIPEWALELAENADRGQLTLLGRILRSQLHLADPDGEPEAEAPRCACGCGEPVLRSYGTSGGKHFRTGPWLTYIQGHWRGNGGKYRGREVTTPE